jgi:hypothetical protein
MADQRYTGSAAAMQASKSASPSKRGVADEATSMLEHNPAPDSSPARAPSESRAFTIKS